MFVHNIKKDIKEAHRIVKDAYESFMCVIELYTEAYSRLIDKEINLIGNAITLWGKEITAQVLT